MVTLAPARAVKRLLVFVCHYPSPYKPYYDTQLIDFLRAGYEVDVVAAPPLDDTTHEKVLAHGLLQRTRYYPVDASSVGWPGLVRPLARPLSSARFIMQSNGPSLRRKAGDLLRMLTLPRHRPDAILVHTMGVALTFNWLRDWYPDVPMALYYHGGEVPSVKAYEDERVARAFSAFDVVFTNTEFSCSQAALRGCPPEKLRALPVGFDLDEYKPARHRPYRDGGILRLISVGRFSAEKGLEYALESLRMVRETGRDKIHLSLIGDGYLRPQLEEQVRQLGLSGHVDFLGTMTARQVIAELSKVDALLLSSYAHGNSIETQACAVQEAMLMKAMVVTTQVGGVPESIPDVMRPFSVPQRDSQAMADAIAAIYDMPADAMATLGTEGRAFVANRYDIATLNRRLMTELLASTQPG